MKKQVPSNDPSTCKKILTMMIVSLLSRITVKSFIFQSSPCLISNQRESREQCRAPVATVLLIDSLYYVNETAENMQSARIKVQYRLIKKVFHQPEKLIQLSSNKFVT